MNQNEINSMIARINELAKKKKTNSLTDEETIEREQLKAAYRKFFREAFEQRILETTIIDSEGNDVTPEKLKMAKCNLKKN